MVKVSLYEHFKNTSKKLKIVCDWDEVIQATEPYSLWLTIKARSKAGENIKCFELCKELDFATFFKMFWSKDENNWWEMDYSSRGSDLKLKDGEIAYTNLENPFDFYQQAPFLTIAEDLLKLIKEDKIEKLIFLSTGDDRKYEVFRETFGKLDDKISLRLLSEEMKIQPGTRTKCDWIKYNAKDFDIFIDDNPFICRSLLDSKYWPCDECLKTGNDLLENCKSGRCSETKITILAPYYPAVESQHHKEVLLVKNEVSELKKEDFKN